MKCFVTGGVGFIGSNLVDRLITDGNEVTCFDNFSSGQEKFLKDSAYSRSLHLIKGDLLDPDMIKDSIKGHDIVFHLAANADVRHGPDHPRKDLEQNTIATFNILEGMIKAGIKRIVFSSTGSVYGETQVIPTPEDAPFPVQTSLYGASKLACEGLISAFCEAFDMKAWIFRFVSITGERYSHGHVFDFCMQLIKDPSQLVVLGDGSQKKSYLYVRDCINGVLMALKKTNERINIFNLGTDEYIEVKESVRTIVNALGVNPRITYTGGIRGWIGDNSFIYLDCSKIRKLGWQPELSIRESIIRTVQYIMQNQWILNSRE